MVALNHIGEQTKRAPSLRRSLSPTILPDDDFGDYYPSVEVYALENGVDIDLNFDFPIW